MDEWWNSLSTELKFFYGIGIISTFTLIVQAVLMMIGGDGGDGADVDVDTPDTDGLGEHPSDLNVLSVKTIIAFFMGFGWMGVICLENNYSLELTILLSSTVGLIFLSMIYYLMKSLYGLRDSGNIHYKNAIGHIANVYIPIPPNRSGAGQVELMVQGRVRFVSAFTPSTQKINSNTRVKVVDIIDPATLLVEPIDKIEEN